MTVWVLLLFAGLSETTGRLLPLVVRRRRASRASVIRLLIAGTIVQALVFALWPLTAWLLAVLTVRGVPDHSTVTWTVGSAAPLLLTGVLSFPLLGPALHFVVLVVAGAALSGDLAALSGSGWWAAVGCVVGAGLILAVLLGSVRRAVAAWTSVEEPEWSL